MLYGSADSSVLDVISLLHRRRHNPAGIPIPAHDTNVETAMATLSSCYCTTDNKSQGSIAAFTIETTLCDTCRGPVPSRSRKLQWVGRENY
ncbi:uncharacterized protein BO87DRAFT_36989 [Aspergillus neoniger CBS 115656]|uniref:Uncharacterized protein n=1 Tax=Aspergillus neoniger (strain CBS 115656) TaxID=1448310 RepID=A0A318YQH8_ASPNB|nr:hypothetical protein BO87DRAFT_34053 [Aspergillus neoniger CBS 115656]XP_025480572.1 hypothetical protein BO87DRAFT_36989 [Aspergillus neoniger CBS 115656]PYH34983.1 hypothetical protein BO87DRAFT_34053 [Aspergillus neoniger CBS 115656]PYH35094.1 hypothetical protein BO87DRAFT_36989 [Aspergillus neoniger CBS 115656]